MKQFHHIFWFWLPPIGYMAAIFMMSSVSLPEIGFEAPDYILHALEYFLLALLLMRLFLSKQVFHRFLTGNKESLVNWRQTCLIAVVIAIGYGISDEIHQYFVPGRHCSLHDVFSDIAGTLLAYGVAQLDYLFLNRCRSWVGVLKRFGAVSSVSYAMYRFR